MGAARQYNEAQTAYKERRKQDNKDLKRRLNGFLFWPSERGTYHHPNPRPKLTKGQRKDVRAARIFRAIRAGKTCFKSKFLRSATNEPK